MNDDFSPYRGKVWAALDGLVVKSPAFGTEGRRFETMKGYTPDSDMLQDDRCVRATL